MINAVDNAVTITTPTGPLAPPPVTGSVGRAGAGLGRCAVMTWNIATSDLTPQRINSISRHIIQHDVDVALLQETTAMPSSEPDQELRTSAEMIAHHTGLTWVTQGDQPLRQQQCAILVHPKYTTYDTGVLQLNHLEHPQNPVWADVSINGKRVNFIAAHLIWGGERSSDRLAALNVIMTAADSAHERGDVVLGMDANTPPASDEIRWLTGLTTPPNFSGTYWTDVAAALHAEAPTSVLANNPLAYIPAKAVGISAPELLIDRRIDYLMVKGFAHGRFLSPLWVQTGTTDRQFVSDHTFVVAHLWDGTHQ